MILRATFLLLSSQVVFLFSGLLVNIGLARMLGPESFGLFGVVLSILVVTELLVITGIPEAIQKFGAESPERMRAFVHRTLPVQVVYVLIISFLFWLLSPIIARIFHDERLTVLLRIAGFDILFLGLYKYVLAIQNGMRRYRNYATLNITYSVVRAFGILLLVYLGYSIYGALVGNFLCSFVALLFGLFITRLPEERNLEINWPWKSFVAQNVFYFVALNMLFAVDVWFVKYFLTDNAVGQYISAANIAKLIYFLSIAISAVILPELSHSFGQNDFERVRNVVQNLFRWLLILLALIILIVLLYAQKIILLFYGHKFIAAYKIFQIVIFAYALITLSALTHTILISLNKMSSAFFLIIAMLFIDIICNRFFVPLFGPTGAAMAAGITGALGVVGGIYFVGNLLENIHLRKTLAKILLSSLVTLAFSLFLQTLVSNLFVQIAASSTIYGLLLFLTREISDRDIGEMLLALKLGES